MRYVKQLTVYPKKFYILTLLLVLLLICTFRLQISERTDCTKQTKYHRHTRNYTPLNISSEFTKTWTYTQTSWIEQACKKPSLFMIFIPIKASDIYVATLIQSSWARDLKSHNGSLLFYIINNDNAINSTQETSSVNILYANVNFKDYYSNLSLKILSFMQWFTSCTNIEYLIKSDTDTFWDIEAVSILLKSLKPSDKSQLQLVGAIQQQALVARDISAPYYASELEYKGTEYPDYAAGGSGYILSMSAVKAIVSTALNQHVFWLEDVYITGILLTQAAKTNNKGLTYVDSDRFYYCRPTSLSRWNFHKSNAFTLHSVSPLELTTFSVWIESCKKHTLCSLYREASINYFISGCRKYELSSSTKSNKL